jgi:outer membrane biosynthesis protein TonB
MKTLIGLVIGIIVTAAIIVPIAHLRTEAKLEAQRTQIELEAAQAEIEALKAAQMAEKPTENKETAVVPVSTEPPEATDPPEPAKIVEITSEETETEETAAIDVKAETTHEPTASPQVKPTPKPEEYPKYFYEDGQKYAYIDEFHENEGMKTLIADDDEPNATQDGYYDPKSDPLSKIPGPFN